MKVNIKSKIWRVVLIGIIFLLLGASFTWGKTQTGFFLSLGQAHYSYHSFSNDQTPVKLGQPSDLFFGISLSLDDQWELGVIYNRSTEDYGADPTVVTFDKDGFGLEAGKIIPVHLFRKNSFDVAIHFSGGGYGMIYPFKKRKSGSDVAYFDIVDRGKMFGQAGFYWAIRLKYMIAGKVSLDVGFKSLVPVRSNEYKITRGKEILMTRSFFTIGVSF